MTTSTVYWCITSKLKVPLIFVEWTKRFCGWIYHFSISFTLAVLQRQKSLLDIGGTTSFIATMKKMNLEMSSAVCPPYYLADNQLIAYIPHYNLHRLHWCDIFLWVMYMLWYFHTHCCSPERGGHCGVGLAVAGCTGIWWSISVQLAEAVT